MSHFMIDGQTALPAVKSDLRTPTGATTNWESSDANKLRQALVDLRSFIVDGTLSGAAQRVTGTAGGNTALISLLMALETLGLIGNATDTIGKKETAVASDAQEMKIA